MYVSTYDFTITTVNEVEKKNYRNLGPSLSLFDKLDSFEKQKQKWKSWNHKFRLSHHNNLDTEVGSKMHIWFWILIKEFFFFEMWFKGARRKRNIFQSNRNFISKPVDCMTIRKYQNNARNSIFAKKKFDMQFRGKKAIIKNEKKN